MKFKVTYLDPSFTLSLSLLIYGIGFVLQLVYHDTTVQVNNLCKIILRMKIVTIQIFMGIGLGGMMSMLLNLISIASPPKYFSAVAGMNTLFRVVGGAVGPVVSNVFINDQSFYVDPDGSSGPSPVRTSLSMNSNGVVST